MTTKLYDVSGPEIFSGERKSEKAGKEVKEVSEVDSWKI